MKKIAFLLFTFAGLLCRAQIVVNEPMDYKGITLQSAYVHVIVTAQAKYIVNKQGQVTGIDTVITLTGHQYASLTAYLSGSDALQVPALIDHVTYTGTNGVGYYPHYKQFLLDKNKGWESGNIVILQ